MNPKHHKKGAIIKRRSTVGHTLALGSTGEGTGAFYTIGADTPSSILEYAIMSGRFKREHVKKGQIYVGGNFKQLVEGNIIPMTSEGKPYPKEEYYKMVTHPSHVVPAISHESLHQTLHKVGEHRASSAIDAYRVFGHHEYLSPTGLIAYEIIRERSLKDLERRGIPSRLRR